MRETTMKVVTNDILGESYTAIDHASGLRIFVYPKPGYASAYAVFGTRYGSIDTRYKRSDRDTFTELPEGTAHFLEHKLFESEELDAFERYAKTGANANAFTSFERTCYLFSCTGHFKENFEILLDFVRHPYFTEETVRKEQGIIGQEIDMYKDSADWESLFLMLGAMYHSHPVKIDIAGTKQSIAQISAEMLFDCYATYYNLANMALAVTGNVSVDEVLEVADRVLKPDPAFTVERQVPDEPDTVLKTYAEEPLAVMTPTFCFGYKENHTKPESTLQEEVGMALLLEIAAGQMTDFYNDLMHDGLINDTFATEYFNGYGYASSIFSGESTDPRAVAERIKQRLAALKETGVTADEFETVRRKQYGKTVRAFTDIDTVANGLLVSHFAGEELFSEFDVLRSLTPDFINDLLRRSFREDRSVLSVIVPKQ